MRIFILVFLLSVLLSACGAAPMQSPQLLVTITGEPQAVAATAAFAETEAPGEAPSATITLTFTPGATSTPLLTATPLPTSTPAPSLTPTVPTPTETLLPPLDLPTEKPYAPALLPWTGEPTYPGDSETGRLFRVDYDPDLWAQMEGNYGEIVLAHRQIEYCSITAWSGRGLPADWKVEHEFREVGTLSVSSLGEVKFVAYVGGDKRILTGFQVTFQEQKDECLAAAEVIFATLRSFFAEPTITPTWTPEPPATPEETPTPDGMTPIIETSTPEATPTP